MSSTELVFTTLTGSPDGTALVRRAIGSLRAFGGPYRDCAVWVFDVSADGRAAGDLAGLATEVLPLDLPTALRGLPYGAKVAACARAEARLSGEGPTGDSTGNAASLVWLASDCLIVHPPELLVLSPEVDVAVRPVHHRNVGLPYGVPLDDFWRGVYAAVGAQGTSVMTRTFVEDEPLFAYYNTHLVAARPRVGLFRRWLGAFETLASDAAFMAQACADGRHRVFLHQTPLSALIATTVAAERVRQLPPTYSYPYNLQDQIPYQRRAKSLNELVCVATEGRDLDPEQIDDIAVEGSLRAWLAASAR